MEALQTTDYDEEELLQMLDEMARAGQADPTYQPDYWKTVIQRILQSGRDNVYDISPKRGIFSLGRFAVAASIILIAGIGSYFLFFNKPQDKIVKTTVPHD